MERTRGSKFKVFSLYIGDNKHFQDYGLIISPIYRQKHKAPSFYPILYIGIGREFTCTGVKLDFKWTMIIFLLAGFIVPSTSNGAGPYKNSPERTPFLMRKWSGPGWSNYEGADPLFIYHHI